MSTRVNLPPGCYGVKMQSDGTEYNAKPGRSVVVEDRHAQEINRSSNGTLGIVSGTLAVSVATRAGMRCVSCGFLAQGWAKKCPRDWCGGDVIREDE